MSVQTPASRPAGKSVGAAGVGLLLTLAVFVGVFVTFLVAPLLVLLVAYLGYVVARPRAGRPDRPASSGAAGADVPAGDPAREVHGFGSGAR